MSGQCMMGIFNWQMILIQIERLNDLTTNLASRTNGQHGGQAKMASIVRDKKPAILDFQSDTNLLFVQPFNANGTHMGGGGGRLPEECWAMSPDRQVPWSI